MRPAVRLTIRIEILFNVRIVGSIPCEASAQSDDIIRGSPRTALARGMTPATNRMARPMYSVIIDGRESFATTRNQLVSSLPGSPSTMGHNTNIPATCTRTFSSLGERSASSGPLPRPFAV